jgi:hypothetical protein
MALPRFFKLSKPRQFHYEPVFYDERRERMQERIHEAEQKLDVKSDGQFRQTINNPADNYIFFPIIDLLSSPILLTHARYY